MNLLNMLPWYQWLILGLVPPLILSLYFLKLRRVPLEVPSTYLWTKTIEDMHVNSIWQRLRKNLLMWLQLLVVLILMLACLRPGCEGEKLAGDRFIFLVDKSASMSATDTESGITRLDEAKNQIYTLIDRMKSTDAAMVISFSDTEGVDQSYTKNKSVLKRKVKSIQVTQQGSDLNRALIAATGLANPGRTSDKFSNTDVQVADALAATMYIFSDGAIKKVNKYAPGELTAVYQPVGAVAPASNVGITTFSVNDQLDTGGTIEAFVRLQNSGFEPKTVGISLFIGDQLTDADTVTVPGREISESNMSLGSNDRLADIDQSPPGGLSLKFDLTSVAGVLESAAPIRFKIDEADEYLLDNEAYCVLNPSRLTNVLVVTDYNPALKLASSTDRLKKIAKVTFVERSFLKEKDYQTNAALGIYDLVIFDQCSPETMPACNTVFFSSLPSGEDWKFTKDLEITPIIYTNNSHPIMFDVQMQSVSILNGQIIKGPKGSTNLVESVDGSIIAIGPRSGFEDIVIGFPMILYEEDGDTPYNTDWHKKPSFPFFMQNIIRTLGSGSRFNSLLTNRPGKPVKIKPRYPYDEIDIKNPQGKQQSLQQQPNKSFVYNQAEETGIYSVSEKGNAEVDQLFAVNLLDRLESDIAVRDELMLGYEAIKGNPTREPARRDFWTILAFLALAVLTLEWVVYNRRVFI
ncbi:BatA and WFA domain-containing protein [Mariniblastus sp.]|nr:BatA and WFA domain-containing protein [bacterium]MDC0294629.1 BatA and WFA domain-containing protein [Mariniblastus sp.]